MSASDQTSDLMAQQKQVEQFEILIRPTRLVLSGDLIRSPQVLAKCSEALSKIPLFPRLSVDAHDVRLSPEGVTIWIEAVHSFLMGCELTYTPSQLGLILQYDDRYKHPKTTFQEYGTPALRQKTSHAAD